MPVLNLRCGPGVQVMVKPFVIRPAVQAQYYEVRIRNRKKGLGPGIRLCL